jgi:hypothetical protein
LTPRWRHVPVVDRAHRLDAAHGVGEEDLVGGEEVGEGESILPHGDAGRAGRFQHTAAGDAGEDATVGGGRRQPVGAGAEDVAARDLEDLAVIVDQQGDLAAAGIAGVEHAPVGPLVCPQSPRDDDASQRDPPGRGREELLGADLVGRDRGLHTVPGPGDDGEAQAPAGDVPRAGGDRLPGVGGQRGVEDGGDAGGEPLDVGVDLHRLAVEDEQGLEEAPGGIGVGRTHGTDILTR